MAIGFNLPGIPGQIRGTAEEAGAVPDLGQAMMKGFRSNLDNIQGAPRLLSQQLLSNALANKIRGVEAQYAEPMAKTKYDQALANLRHQGLINQYYGRMQESALRGQGLSQEHQQMINASLKRQLERQKRYDDLIEQYRQQGATLEQAHQLATQDVDQTHPMPEQAPAPQQDLAQTILGAQMPDYLANIAPQRQQVPADVIGQNVPYSAMLQPQFGQPQAQAFQLPPEPQAAPEYLQRPEELAQAMQTQAPEEEAPQQQQAGMTQQAPQSYAQQLQQAGFNTTGMNSAYEPYDELYLKNPNYRDLLKKEFPNVGTKVHDDFARNRQIITDTLPSGATKTTIQPLGGEAAADDKYATQLEKLIKLRDKFKKEGNMQDLNLAEQNIKKLVSEGTTTLVQQPKPPAGATYVYDTDGKFIGYDQPQTNDEKKASRASARFNVFYDVVEKGVSPYQGTPGQVISQLAYDKENQKFDPESRERLYNLSLAMKALTSTAASDLGMLDAPRVKNVLASLREAVGSPSMPQLASDIFVKYQVDRETQNRAQKAFGDLNRKAIHQAEIAAAKKTFVPARRTANLKDNINQGMSSTEVKSPAQTKPATQAKPKARQKIIITPDMVKGL